MTVTPAPALSEAEAATVARFEAAPTPPEVVEAARVEEVARQRRFIETAMRCLDRALCAMNRAIEITTAEGPAVAIEFIADYLNNTDSIDEDVVDRTPDDWLTRWQVTPVAAPSTGGRCARCVGEGWTGPDDPRPSATCDDCNGTGVHGAVAAVVTYRATQDGGAEEAVRPLWHTFDDCGGRCPEHAMGF